MAVDKRGKKGIKLKMRRLYRPENTCLSRHEALCKDRNLLYWSEDFITVDVNMVHGKCQVRNLASLEESADSWSAKGFYRFYFNETYNRQAKKFEELSETAEKYGITSRKGSGKGKEKSGFFINFVLEVTYSVYM